MTDYPWAQNRGKLARVLTTGLKDEAEIREAYLKLGGAIQFVDEPKTEMPVAPVKKGKAK